MIDSGEKNYELDSIACDYGLLFQNQNRAKTTKIQLSTYLRSSNFKIGENVSKVGFSLRNMCNSTSDPYFVLIDIAVDV